MKRVILTLGLAFSLFKANGQIIVKETAKDSVVWSNKLMGLPKLVNFYTKEESNYTIYYQNAKYTTITDIDYISLGDKATAIQFFDILKNVIDSGERSTIELDGNTWLISKSMTNASIWSSTTSFYLTRKNIETILETINTK